MARNKFNELHQMKYDLFKLQDPKIGHFDVIFELQGKRLYAHKTMLNLVSDTFSSMLSERWTPNDEVIKLQDYTFDEFYQFLTFLYSGECQLTDENIVAMVDIAEFYHVELFKAYCDEYLADMKLTKLNIFRFFDLAVKYSLVQLYASVQSFIVKHFSSFVDSEHFMNLEKPVVKKIVAAITDKVKQEKLFEAVYKWVEKQERDSTLDKNDSIKSEIGTFLPYINFYKMDISFLIQFVVPRGFIFSSLDVLSKILYGVNPRIRKVTVTSVNGQKVYGYPLLNQAITNLIKTITLPCYKSGCSHCLWKGKVEMPSTPSSLHKRNDVEWYLVIFSGGEIGLVHSTSVCGHYLLAEMAQEEGGNFYITPGCKIEIE